MRDLLKPFENPIKKKVIVHVQDPSHGWLKVPIMDLVDLNLMDKLTIYSYRSRSGETAYLEEDLDAMTFMNALCEYHRIPKSEFRNYFTLAPVVTNTKSVVRTLPSLK